MSRTTLYGIEEDGSWSVIAEFRNSHGSAAAVWTHLVEKYDIDPDGFIYDRWEKLWKEKKHEARFLDYEWYVLMTTYDRAVLPADLVPVVADAMERFYEEYKSVRPDYVCSLDAQAKALRMAVAEGTAYFAWNQTSVCESWLWIRDEEEDEIRPANLIEDAEILNAWMIQPRETT
jgi:hypothetical protein